MSWRAMKGREMTVFDGPNALPFCHFLCVPQEQQLDAKQMNDNKKSSQI